MLTAEQRTELDMLAWQHASVQAVADGAMA